MFFIFLKKYQNYDNREKNKIKRNKNRKKKKGTRDTRFKSHERIMFNICNEWWQVCVGWI